MAGKPLVGMAASVPWAYMDLVQAMSLSLSATATLSSRWRCGVAAQMEAMPCLWKPGVRECGSEVAGPGAGKERLWTAQ
jgi:hypothetical protein